jgi:hypothetical protein
MQLHYHTLDGVHNFYFFLSARLGMLLNYIYTLLTLSMRLGYYLQKKIKLHLYIASIEGFKLPT